MRRNSMGGAISPSPSSKWSSPTRRKAAVENFEVWDEWLNRPDECHPPTLDFFPGEDIERGSSTLGLEAALQRTGVDILAVASSSACVWHPSSRSRLSWEILGVPVLAYDLVLIPMQVFLLPASILTDVMCWVTMLYWTFDLFATFNVAYYTKDGKLVGKRSKIVKNYLCSTFLLDFFVVGMDWLLVAADSMQSGAFEALGIGRIGKLLRVLRIFRLLRLLRLHKLRQIASALQDQIDSEYLSIICNICKNLACITVGSHFVACLWFWVGTHKVKGYTTWVSKYMMNNSAWEYQYWTSLHWVVCQFTPGAMSVQATNVPEKMFSVGMLLCSLLVFSMFVSSTTGAIMALQKLGSKNARQLWLLRKFFRQNSLSRELQVRIMRYVNVVLLPQQEHIQFRDLSILGHLSTPLHVELQTELHMPNLTTHAFFDWFSNTSLLVLQKICCVALKRTSLSKDDVLFAAGQKASEMFFPVAGHLVYTPMRENHLKIKLGKGEWCTEAILWCQWVHHGLLLAKMESELIGLNAKKFGEVVTDHYIDVAYAQSYGVAFVQALNEAAKEAEARGHGYISDLSSSLLETDTMKAVLDTYK